MTSGRVHLRLLGGVELCDPDGRPVRALLAQPKRLALLIYLATAKPGGFHRKDILLALFWPDSNDRRARLALNRAVYFLRKALTPNVVVTRGNDEVGVAGEYLQCDAVGFEQALAAGAPDTALEFYRGDFAPGLLLSGVPGFERWLESERSRLREQAVKAATDLAEREEASGRLARAERWAHRATVLAPYDERAASRRIRLLDRMGDRANALRAFEELLRRLRDDLQVDPSPETLALVAAVRGREEPGSPAAESDAASTPWAAPVERRGHLGHWHRPEPSPRRWSRWPALVGAVATVTLGLVLGVRRFGQRAGAPATARAVAVTSEPGIEYQPALSPDGSLVAFTTLTSGRMAITVRSAAGVPGAGELHPAGRSAENQLLPSWGTDGESIRFASTSVPTENEYTTSWQEVSRRGGAPRPINLPQKARSAAWSRDGAMAVFGVKDSIFLHGTAESSTRLLAVHEGGWEPHSFAWSPDGKWIAYVNGNPFWPTRWNTSPAGVWLVSPSSGRRVAITDETHLNVSPAWLDDRSLFYVSDREGQREVYLVNIGKLGATGSPVMIPGGTDAHSISVSADGRHLAVAKLVARQNIWSFPLGMGRPLSIGEGRPVTTGSQVVETHGVSPDGEWLAYDTNLHGDADIYLIRIKGGTPIPLITGPTPAFSPRWSPDGREIAFYSGPTGDIQVVSAAGGAPIQLTAAPGVEETPVWSPDGLALAYRAHASGRAEVWIVSRQRIGGVWGVPKPLSSFGCDYYFWTRDGTVTCSRSGETQLTSISLAGRVLRHRDLAAAGLSGLGPAVPSPDGSALYLGATRGGRTGIWAVPASGNDARLVVSFDDPALAPAIFAGSISVAREQLYLTVGEFESDIWVMDLKR